ncbi:hypothetical protein D9M68_734550 [compost metagenome]
MTQIHTLVTQEVVIGDADPGQGAVQRRGPHQEDEEAVVDARCEAHDQQRHYAEQRHQQCPTHFPEFFPSQLTQADDRGIEDVDHAGDVGEGHEPQGNDPEGDTADMGHPHGRIAVAERGCRQQPDHFAQRRGAEDPDDVWPERRPLVLAQPSQVADIGPPGKARGDVHFHRDNEVDAFVVQRRIQCRQRHQLGERVLAEDHVEHHRHDHYQCRRDDGVAYLDRGRPLGHHKTGQDNRHQA